MNMTNELVQRLEGLIADPDWDCCQRGEAWEILKLLWGDNADLHERILDAERMIAALVLQYGEMLTGRITGTTYISDVEYSNIVEAFNPCLVVSTEDNDRMKLKRVTVSWTVEDATSLQNVDTSEQVPMKRKTCRCGGLCDSGHPCPMGE